MAEKLRILVAEDDPNDAFLLDRALTKIGVSVPIKFVHDGQEAIEYLSDDSAVQAEPSLSTPTLLLLDLKMPRKGGFEVLDWIRKQPGLRRLLVLVFSASSEQRDVDHAYDAGANGYLVKPTEPTAWPIFIKAFNDYWLKTNRYPNCENDKDG